MTHDLQYIVALNLLSHNSALVSALRKHISVTTVVIFLNIYKNETSIEYFQLILSSLNTPEVLIYNLVTLILQTFKVKNLKNIIEYHK